MTENGSDSPQVAIEHLNCVSCGYNLNTLAVTARCPECGTPVMETVVGDKLENADAAWLKKITRGMHLMLNVPMWWMGVLVWLGTFSIQSFPDFIFSTLAVVFECVPCGVTIYGIYLIGSVEPIDRRSKSVSSASVMWRIIFTALAIVASVICYALIFAMQATLMRGYAGWVALAFAFTPLLLAPTLLHLAKRLRAKSLVWQMRIACVSPAALATFYWLWAESAFAPSARTDGLTNTIAAMWLFSCIAAFVQLVHAWFRMMAKLSAAQALAAANEFRSASESSAASGMIGEVKNVGAAGL